MLDVKNKHFFRKTESAIELYAQKYSFQVQLVNQVHLPFKGMFTYGRKSADRIATPFMAYICNLWRLIVSDWDFAESYEWFLSG